MSKKSMLKTTLHEEILNVLKKRAAAEHDYINPYFLLEITRSLDEFYSCEDDVVNSWVQDMYSA